MKRELAKINPDAESAEDRIQPVVGEMVDDVLEIFRARFSEDGAIGPVNPSDIMNITATVIGNAAVRLLTNAHCVFRTSVIEGNVRDDVSNEELQEAIKASHPSSAIRKVVELIDDEAPKLIGLIDSLHIAAGRGSPDPKH